MTGPATCPLCGGSDSAPQMLLRCNNHALKRMHTTTQLSVVVKRSAKASWAQQSSQWMHVTVKSYHIEPPDDIERNIPY